MFNQTIGIAVVVAILLGGGVYWYYTQPVLEQEVVNDSPAATAVRMRAAAELGVRESDVVVISETSRDWPDGCLGLAHEGEFCMQAIVSGFEVVVEINGERHTYRTDIDGLVIRRQ